MHWEKNGDTGMMASFMRKMGFTALAVAALVAPSGVASAAQADNAKPDVVADWKFQKSNSTGDIDDGNVVIKDASGNGNDLRMETYGKGDYKLSDYVSWDTKSMNGDANGSLKLNGDSDLAHKKQNHELRDPKGADFITVDNAPINKETFAKGYTLEFVYYLPDDFNAGSDAWMGIAARQSANSGMDEHEMGSMSLAISNCKETQFKAANVDNQSTQNTSDPNNGVTSWGVTMDHGGVWYHIAIVSDGTNVVTYTNGAKAFRNINKNGNGLYADPTDGRFRIGSAYYNDTYDTSKYDKEDFDKFLRGNLQEVRFSRGAVQQNEWVIPNPTETIKEYGTNDKFVLANPSVNTMVFLPDTQNTIRWVPDVMDKAIDQLDAEAASQHVSNIVSLGDIVDNWDSIEQWEYSKLFFDRLQNTGIPFLEQPGNHDYNGSQHGYGWPGGRVASNYLTYFGPDSAFGAKQKANGFTYSPDGMSSYVTVDNGSYKYLIVNIDMGAVTGNSSATSNDDMRWFEQVLKDHPNNPTVVVSHDIFMCSDSHPNQIALDTDRGYNAEGGDSEGAGSKVWNIVKKYNQVFMMYSGHNHGSGQMTLTNDSGNQVLGLLADYQFGYNGGNAFFQYIGLDEAANKLTMRTYSPYSASLKDSERSFFDVNFLTGEGNVYSQDFDFAKRFAGYEHSASYDRQQEIVKVVRGIGALTDTADADTVKALYQQFKALPDATRAEFGDEADASSLAGKLAAAYKKATAGEGGQQPQQPDQNGGNTPNDKPNTKPSTKPNTNNGSHQAANNGKRPQGLSRTGASITLAAVVAVAALVLGGATVMVVRRRR